MKCRHTKICRETYGIKNNDNCIVDDAWECPIADKIEDIIMDAKEAMKESEEYCDNEDYE